MDVVATEASITTIMTAGRSAGRTTSSSLELEKEESSLFLEYVVSSSVFVESAMKKSKSKPE